MQILDQIVKKMVEEEVVKIKQELLIEFTSKFDRTLDVKEAAEYLGMSTQLVYRLCTEKRIPHIRFGATGSKRPIIKFKLSALEKWLNSQTEVVK